MAKQSSVNLDITNNPDGFDISGGTTLRKLSVTGGNVTIAGSGSATVTFPTTSTTVAGLGIAQSFTALQTFSAGISASGATFSGNIAAVAGTFTGTFSGATGSFSRLLTASAGLSAIGATFSGDIAVQGGDITTSSATATVFNTTATTLSIGSAATTLTIGAASGVATIRNPTLNIGTTAGLNYIGTPQGASSNLYIQPFGALYLAPTTNAPYLGSFPQITIDNTSGALGEVFVQGGNLHLGVKTTNDEDYTAVDLVFEGASQNFNQTTVTVVDPTADRTITLPDASGIVALTNTTVASINGFTGAVQVTGSGAVVHSVSGTTTILGARLASISVTGVASFDPRHFAIGISGHVSLTGPYQVTGQTIVAGNSISTTTLGNTVTINVTAGGANNSIQFNDNGRLTGSSDFTYDPSTGETIITVGGSARSISFVPGADAFVQSNGNSALNLMGGNSGVGIVRLGDVNGNGDGTTIELNDGTRTISLSSSDYLYASAAYTTLSGNLIAVGATFSGNISVGGNATLGNAATDTTTIYGTKIVNEGIYANGSLRTANISFANGQVQTLTGVGTGATGMTAIYFTGAPSTGAASITAIITNGGLMTGAGMTSWGGNIKWPGAIKPVLTSSGVDVVSFVTPDAGTTIYGFVGGLGFS